MLGTGKTGCGTVVSPTTAGQGPAIHRVVINLSLAKSYTRQEPEIKMPVQPEV